MPFQQVSPADEAVSGAVPCPVCGMIFDATKSAGNPETVLETLFLEQLDKKRPKFSVVAGERAAGVFRRISADSLTVSLREVLREVGTEMEAEGVVIGYVYRFRERKGVSYTVEQPASVADGDSVTVRLVFSGEGKVGHGERTDGRGGRAGPQDLSRSAVALL